MKPVGSIAIEPTWHSLFKKKKKNNRIPIVSGRNEQTKNSKSQINIADYQDWNKRLQSIPPKRETVFLTANWLTFHVLLLH